MLVNLAYGLQPIVFDLAKLRGCRRRLIFAHVDLLELKDVWAAQILARSGQPVVPTKVLLYRLVSPQVRRTARTSAWKCSTRLAAPPGERGRRPRARRKVFRRSG